MDFIVLMFVVAVTVLIVIALIANNVQVTRGMECMARLPAQLNLDQRIALKWGQGAIGINTTSGNVAAITPDGYLHSFHVSSLIDVRFEQEVKTRSHRRHDLNTNAWVTDYSRDVNNYVVLTVDDFNFPTVMLPFGSMQDAQRWDGLLKVLKNRFGAPLVH